MELPQTEEEARELIRALLAKYPGLEGWLDRKLARSRLLREHRRITGRSVLAKELKQRVKR